MTRTRYRIFETHYPYFMTCTIAGWLPVFTRADSVDIILDSWRFLQNAHEFSLYGYVILENHVHLVASAPELALVMQRFKSYTARQIIDWLKTQAARQLLAQLRALKRRHKIQSDHQFWQEGSHPQQIGTDEMMRQKLDYIHMNPVKRGYVDDPVHWRYSSARNYAGLPGLIEVITDWG
jgi:REP element-mobilizing transposase RayT